MAINKKTKPWYESRTIWIGIAIVTGSVFAYLESRYPTMSIFGTISGILVIVNRFISPGTPIR